MAEYRTAWNSRWKNPCILELLLSDDRKAQKTILTLEALGFRINLYTNGKWFDIVSA